MTLLLAESGSGLRVWAGPAGLHVFVAPGADEHAAVRLQSELLLEAGLAETEAEGAVRLPWEHVADVLAMDLTLPVRWTRPSPFVLAIGRISDLGRPDFRYRYEFHHGTREVALERTGYYVRRSADGQVYHLDPQTFALVEAMDAFNALPADARTGRRAWLTFAEVKGCAREVGAALDNHLTSNDVVVPSRLAVSAIEHPDGSISFVPRTPGDDDVPQDALARLFLRTAAEPEIYTLESADRRRVRVVFDERQAEALRRMRGARGLRGERKASALAEPEQFFEGVQDVVDVQFGRRVIGIGEFAFAPAPAGTGSAGGFLDLPESPHGNEDGRPEKPGARPTAITIPSADGGSPVRLEFADEAARGVFAQRIREALSNGDTVVEHQGVRVAPSPELLEALDQPLPAGGRGAGGSRYLLIYTDEEDVNAEDVQAVELAAAEMAGGDPLQLPASLDDAVALKPHQEAGVKWLQRSAAQPGRRGVLLADDMGLGKTLQVLVHLAWSIEQGKLRLGEGDAAPWRPILIVAPLILIENETWVAEMQRFFRHSGDVFHPVLRLHGTGVDAVRRSGAAGRETQIGEPTLDPARLQQYRVVITNYETVVNYQFSLAQKVRGQSLWSMMITDEAQKYKAMNTKVSHALKALEPDFHIACTGTPVENRLLDLWNVFDTVQPALLGSAREFSRLYERPLEDDPRAPLDSLRERLLFGRSNAFLLRRDKRQLAGLPDKREVLLDCEMSPAEVQTHLELIAAVREDDRPGRYLGALQRLSALYQHPALLSSEETDLDRDALLAGSSKLRAVIARLHEIRARREKVIVFAGLVRMQQILAHVLREEFGIPVHIVNGETSRSGCAADSAGMSRRGRETRQAILREFRERPGFHVIILSPFVAGVGLTLTEANHVIHYGRWWNPALEDQATDRVYRIGQERPVEVCLPILRDRTGHLGRTFDERLHDLIERKRALRSDFLRPGDGEDANARELLGSLLEEAPPGQPLPPLAAADVSRLDPFQFEALVACLYDRQGYQTVLTPKSGDGGADVIAVRGGQWVLVQAKHSRNSLDDRVIQETLAAGELYTSRLGPGGQLHVLASSAFTSSAIHAAGRSGVTLVGGAQLVDHVAQHRITMADVFRRLEDRAFSFEETLRSIRRLRD